MHVIFPSVKTNYDKIMRPISDFFHIKLKMQPNHVSLLGFCIGLLSVVLILLSHWQLGLVLMVISLLFDGIDGNIARMYGLQSKTGENLELIFDRSLEALIFIALAFHFGIDYRIAFLAIYSILLMTSLRDKAKFDPGLKRIALLFCLVMTFEIIFTFVFFVHIFSFILQLVILDYKNQEESVEFC
ncbi:MAG: CDP-alcohol phosphatidyltransferase family protein [Candidatus Hodarchaeales archaeon]|jgi:phosphatidylglycerophosphate synthase